MCLHANILSLGVIFFNLNQCLSTTNKYAPWYSNVGMQEVSQISEIFCLCWILMNDSSFSLSAGHRHCLIDLKDTENVSVSSFIYGLYIKLLTIFPDPQKTTVPPAISDPFYIM